MSADAIKTARKQLEKKSTIDAGMAALAAMLADDATPPAWSPLLEALQRCKTVVLSRHSDGAVWDACTALLATAAALRADHEGDASRLAEWTAQLRKADPRRGAAEAEEEKEKEGAAPQSRGPSEAEAYLARLMAGAAAPPPLGGGAGGGAGGSGGGMPRIEALEEFLQYLQSEGGMGSSETPASRRALRDLTLFTIPHTAAEGEYTCVVCLEGLQPRSKAKKMPCKHLFHEPCLLEWLGKNHTCPTCRYELPKQIRSAHAFFDDKPEADETRREAEVMFS